MGRPVKYTPEVIQEIKDAFEKYIRETEVPIVAEFAHQYGLPRAKLYEIEELNYTVKECIDKKEAQLERLGLTNQVNTTMAIFSLKQLGWRDKHEVEHGGSIVIQFDDALKDV